MAARTEWKELPRRRNLLCEFVTYTRIATSASISTGISKGSPASPTARRRVCVRSRLWDVVASRRRRHGGSTSLLV
jgi:hypothetical protein